MNWKLATVGILLIPVGFATKTYEGPGEFWIRAHAGGVVYVVFWNMVILAVRPRWSIHGVAAAVLVTTCALEFLQLWHSAFLTTVRTTTVGHALIGSTFSWADLVHYVFGSLLAIALAYSLRHGDAGQADTQVDPARSRHGPRRDDRHRSC